MTHEIVEIYREAYYTLRRSQVDQAAAERAWEELAARLATERATLLDKQSELQKLATDKERIADEKEKELGEIVGMMQSALELQMEAKAELKVWKEQVYKLRAELSELRARIVTTLGTHPPA